MFFVPSVLSRYFRAHTFSYKCTAHVERVNGCKFFFKRSSRTAERMQLFGMVKSNGWTDAGFGGWGSRLCCVWGRLLGYSCYLGLGLAPAAPWFQGTPSPCASGLYSILMFWLTFLFKEQICLKNFQTLSMGLYKFCAPEFFFSVVFFELHLSSKGRYGTKLP